MNVRTLRFALPCALVALTMLSMTGCSKDEPPINTPPPPAYDEATKTVLYDLTQNVIIPIVKDFAVRSDSLLAAIKALRDQKTPAALEAARDAWKKSRVPWETCEAFLFGPAKSQQLDPAVDSWPLDGITLDSMLNSSDQFSREYFDASEGTVKGGHAIEYLLWGRNSDKLVTDFTDREFEFLVACTESFTNAAAKLKFAWVPTTEGGDDYAAQLYNSGKQGSLYSSQAAGVREVVNGMRNILREVTDGKMGIPFANRSVDFEEARYSGSSKVDFLSNVLGVGNLYSGTYSTYSGKGISDLVRAKDPALDDKVKAKIQECVTRIGEITPSFGDAIFNNRNSIQTARTSISDLADLFEKDVTEKLGL